MKEQTAKNTNRIDTNKGEGQLLCYLKKDRVILAIVSSFLL